MADEPESPTPETELQKIEAELEAVKAEIEAAPVVAEVEALPAQVVDKVSLVHAEIDAFFENVVRNLRAEIPTRAHNMIFDAIQTLKSKVASLL